jgi:signal peptidase I
MAPTLAVGNHVAVSVDPRYKPQVGDIIVFHPPASAESATPTCGDRRQGAGRPAACSTRTPTPSSQVFIKRIVAGPGDTLQIRNGRAIRNGQQESEPYIAACGPEPFCNFPAPIKIPKADYFVLGENRGQSDDSRFWGPVKRAWIIGKVVKVIH